MTGRGKGGNVKNKAQFRSNHAGLQFPVGHIHCLFHKGNYAERDRADAPVYLAAVMGCWKFEKCGYSLYGL
jgi:histone H2A